MPPEPLLTDPGLVQGLELFPRDDLLVLAPGRPGSILISVENLSEDDYHSWVLALKLGECKPCPPGPEGPPGPQGPAAPFMSESFYEVHISGDFDPTQTEADPSWVCGVAGTGGLSTGQAATNLFGPPGGAFAVYGGRLDRVCIFWNGGADDQLDLDFFVGGAFVDTVSLTGPGPAIRVFTETDFLPGQTRAFRARWSLGAPAFPIDIMVTAGWILNP